MFGLSESQIARRVKAIAKGRGAGRIGSSSAATAVGWAWPVAWPRTARPPTRSNARAAGNRVVAWLAATPAANPQGRRCGIYDASRTITNGIILAPDVEYQPAAGGALSGPGVPTR